jgi:hypothetical protein
VVQSAGSTHLSSKFLDKFYFCFNSDVLQQQVCEPNIQILINHEHINPIRGIFCELATGDKPMMIDVESPFN